MYIVKKSGQDTIHEVFLQEDPTLKGRDEKNIPSVAIPDFAKHKRKPK